MPPGKIGAWRLNESCLRGLNPDGRNNVTCTIYSSPAHIVNVHTNLESLVTLSYRWQGPVICPSGHFSPEPPIYTQTIQLGTMAEQAGWVPASLL